MDKELLKILVNFRIIQGMLEEITYETKKLADQIEKYIKSSNENT